MVTGIESFKEWFKGNESQYAIIGGTACDILMTEEGLDFRATKDIDLVLIIEAVDAAFGRKFWDYLRLDPTGNRLTVCAVQLGDMVHTDALLIHFPDFHESVVLWWRGKQVSK